MEQLIRGKAHLGRHFCWGRVRGWGGYRRRCDYFGHMHLHDHAAETEGELQTSGCRDKHYIYAILISQCGGNTTACQRQPGVDTHIIAIEVVEVLQVIYPADRVDLGSADVNKRKPLYLDRIVFPSIS